MNRESMRLVQMLRARRGFSAQAFLASHPLVDYHKLGSELAVSVPPIRLMEALGSMCKDEGEILWFVRDLIVRRFEEMCPRGWKAAQEGEDDEISALVAASAVVSMIDAEASKVAERSNAILLQDDSIPIGWRPQSADDRTLAMAFERATDQGAPGSSAPSSSQ
jgi:hypothetical protein